MFSATYLITFADGLSTDEKTAFKTGLAKLARQISPVFLIGDVGIAAFQGGNVLFNLGFKDLSEYKGAKRRSAYRSLCAFLADESTVKSVEFAAYDAGSFGVTSKDAKIHRVLLFSVLKDKRKSGEVGKLEAALKGMPKHIKGMLNFRLSRIVESSGSRTWTHAWVQDFDEEMTFMMRYNLHPYHIGFVDTWFEPECTNWIVDTYLCSSYCPEDKAFLANYAR